MLHNTRREFLAAAAASASALGTPALASPQAKSKKMIGIQIGAVSFLDEGTEQTLDILQSKGNVNTLFIAAFTYGGIAGRQVPNQPLPDHGKQQYDTDNFRGGSYATVHPKYYANTPLKDFRAPDLGFRECFGVSSRRPKERPGHCHLFLPILSEERQRSRY